MKPLSEVVEGKILCGPRRRHWLFGALESCATHKGRTVDYGGEKGYDGAKKGAIWMNLEAEL